MATAATFGLAVAVSGAQDGAPGTGEPVARYGRTEAADGLRAAEMELRGLDPLFVAGFETDYTNDTREGGVTLARLKVTRGVNFLAAYHAGRDALILTTSEDGAILPESATHVAHEGYHVIDDNSGEQKGILHVEGYKGPGEDEIKEYTRKKLEMDLEQLESALEISKVMATAVGDMSQVADVYVPIYRSAQKGWGASQEIFSESVDFEPELEEKERELLRKGGVKKMEALGFFKGSLGEMSRISKEMAEYVKERESQGLFAELERVSSFVRGFRSLLEDLQKYESLPQEIAAYRATMAETFGKAEKRSYDKRLAAAKQKLEKAVTGEEKMEAEWEIEDLKIDHEVFEASMKQEKSMALESSAMTSLASSLGKRISEAYSSNSMRSLEEITEPHEIMARMVDSLYSLYTGKVTEHYFPLTEADLEFLGKFEFRGERIFKKGLEKYQVMLEMVAEGKDTEFVRKLLRRAVELKWKGRVYSWPEQEIEIKGQPPELAEVVELKENVFPDKPKGAGINDHK